SLPTLLLFTLPMLYLSAKGTFMPRGRKAEDLTTLQMALIGYQAERQRIEDKIQELQGRLGGKAESTTSSPAGAKTGRKKRVLSAAARARIAAAQKKRWAEHRKKLAAVSKGE